MSANVTRATVTVSMADLENLIRRVVREEISRLPRTSGYSILDDWSQEGPNDPEGDEELLREALVVLEDYGDKPETWTSLEDLEAELDKAEARGELPR